MTHIGQRCVVEHSQPSASAGLALRHRTTLNDSREEDMAFNNVGPLTYIAAGATHYWWYDRGGGDYGYQAAGPDIKVPNQGARLNASDQGKRKYNSGYTQYYVTIKN